MPHHGISSSVLQPDELKTKQEALPHKTAETNQDNMLTTMLASKKKKGLASSIARWEPTPSLAVCLVPLELIEVDELDK